MRYVFANCELDTQCFCLYRDGRDVPLRPKVFHLLIYLLEHRDRVVSKQELCDHVWKAQYVSDATVENAIKLARQAVGDSRRNQRIIQTFYGHGYRFIASVIARTPQSSDITATAAEQTADPRQSPQLNFGERKVVSILCCSVANLEPNAEGLALDTLHNWMQTLYEWAQQESHRYGGTIQPVTEQHLLIVFGAPVAQEDHAQRAVMTALALRHRMATAQPDSQTTHAASLEMRIGIHTGSIAVGGIGDVPIAGVAMVGPTVSRAIFLQRHARAGTILCGAATAHLVRQTVRLQLSPPLLIDDQKSSTAVYQVTGSNPWRSAVIRRARWIGSPFVGRDHELATLHTLWTQVESGRGQVVGIMGEPGMGKSRLVDAFRRSLRGHSHTYIQSRCLSYGQVSPYMPVRGLLEHACGITAIDRSETRADKVSWLLRAVGMPKTDAAYLLQLWAGQHESAPLEGLSPEELTDRIFAALYQLCIHGCQLRPLILEVEDLHWIDPSSQACLASLVDQLAGLPILLLVTYRPGYRAPWIGRSYATQMALPQLSPEDSQRLVQATLPASRISTALLQEIVTKAEGNPFFLEELARSIGEQSERPPLAVPDTMQSVLAARLDRLSPTAKHLVQVAAVMGKEVPLDWLEMMVDLPEAELSQNLADLQSAKFLQKMPHGAISAYTFVHTLTQEAAYQSLLERPRQQYHRQIADMLSAHCPTVASTEPERLAHHYSEAGLYNQAITYWQQAGQWAVERAAHVEAIRHLTLGLERLQSLPSSAENPEWELDLQLPLGRALAATKGAGSPEVEQVYVRARSLCDQIGATPKRFDVLQGLVTLHEQRAEFQTSRELGQQLLALAEQQENSEKLLRSHRTLGTLHYHIGDMHAARFHLEQAITLYQPPSDLRQTSSLVTNALIYGFSYTALVLWQVGYPDQAVQRSQTALSLAQELAHPLSLAPVLSNLAHLYLLRREMVIAQQWAEILIELATEEGLPYWRAQGMMKRGRALIAQDRFDEGMELILQGLDAYSATGAKVGRPYNLALLAEAYAHSGQIAIGLDLVTEAFATARQSGQRSCETQLYRLQGKLLMNRGHNETNSTRKRTWSEAEASLRQSLVLSDQRHMRA